MKIILQTVGYIGHFANIFGRVISPGAYPAFEVDITSKSNNVRRALSLKEVLDLAGGFNDPIFRKSIFDTIVVLRLDENQFFSGEFSVEYKDAAKFDVKINDQILNLSKKQKVEDLIRNYNFKSKIDKFPSINSFELQSISLRSYYHEKILAFGDLLHRVHPLAGQGFNMTIRDIQILLDIIKKNNSLGLPLNSSVNQTFEKMLKTKNLIFSSGIDLIYEFFNVERKTKNTLLSKTIQYLGKNPNINKVLKKVADKGVIL